MLRCTTMQMNFRLLLLFCLAAPAALMAQRRELSIRQLESEMVQVRDSLYASKFETTNAQYQFFLSELKNTTPDLFSSCQVNPNGWSKLIPPDSITAHYHEDPLFSEYPVVNISYEAAEAYCQWLTRLYNAAPKRKFGKVIFLLPAKEEMIAAALGGKERMYPWGNYYLVNKKGFYLCNFKAVSDAYFVRDSAGQPMIVWYNGRSDLHAAEFPAEKNFYTMKVNSFEPGIFGLFNTSGNVAEMISDPGWAMGGSWNSYGGEIRPHSMKKYFFPSAEVGFRVFMRIIGE